MHFGLALPQYDYSVPGGLPISWETLVGWAREAEALGFRSVWLSDHLFYDLSRYGGPGGVQRGMECFTGLAALAAGTTTVKIGSLVACNDLRAPAVLAKMAATIDVVSGGRLELGVGAGWFEAEYRAAGIPFDPAATRVSRLEESVKILKQLLTRGEARFQGRHYSIDGAVCLPRPVQRNLPVFVGGSGERVARIAGRHSDGFNTAWSRTPEEFAALMDIVDRAAEDGGRDPSTLKNSLGLYTLVGRDSPAIARRWERYAGCSPSGRRLPPLPLWARDKLVGTYERAAETIADLEAAGADELILTFGSIPFQVCDPESPAEFMESVAPLVV